MAANGSNILYLCSDRGIPIGGSKGSSVHIREFLKAIKEFGYSPNVLACRSEEESLSGLEYDVHIIPNHTTDAFYGGANEFGLNKRVLREANDFARNQAVELMLGELHKKEPIDILYERYSLFSIGGCSFARKCGIPFVLEVNAPLVYESSRYRELLLDDLAREVEKFLFTAADCVIVVSEELRSYVRNVAPATRVEVVPNGVNVELFSNQQNLDAWRKKLTVRPNTDFLVTFVGSVKPWHGVDSLIDAIALLDAQGQQISLAVVGNGDSSQNELETSCRERDLQNVVTFTGVVPYEDVPAVLGASDVLVAPYPDLSQFYFSPLKVYEYMAAGKPIVASRIGQIVSLLSDGETGLLVNPGDPSDLAKALLRLKQDRALAKRLGQAASREAVQMHSWKQRIEQVDIILKELISESSEIGKAGYAGTV